MHCGLLVRRLSDGERRLDRIEQLRKELNDRQQEMAALVAQEQHERHLAAALLQR